ncbi:MAG: hypothetical protein RLZZ422_1156 [Pseudomonadota bacterium]|jgi:integrase
MTLTNTQIEHAKPKDKPYRLNDGEGLQLEVRVSGARVWIYRYRNPATKKQTILTIGEYPRITLKQARKLVGDAKGLVKEGIDPNNHKQQQRIISKAERFKEVALEWFENRKGAWSQANGEQVMDCLVKDILPYLGEIPMETLSAPDVLQVVRRVEARGALDKASKVKQRIGAVFRYAVATGRVKYNPVPDLAGALQPKPVSHFKALTPASLPDFLKDLAAYKSEIMRSAVQFTLLTLSRSGSVRMAQWSEIDWEAKEWRIPSEHMKMGVAHAIPLATQALNLLERLQPITGHGALIFYTEKRDKPMSSNAMLSVLKRMGWNDRTTIHGFRAVGSSIMYESGFQRHVIEKALAHAERNEVAGAYNYMASYLPERHTLMQWWADYLDNCHRGAKVIPIFSTKVG